MAAKVSISEIINMMADKARMDGRDPPVIETDFGSAAILAKALMDDLGCRADDLFPGGALNWPYLIEFDGVKIRSRIVTPEELYRDHFGPLVDIWR